MKYNFDFDEKKNKSRETRKHIIIFLIGSLLTVGLAFAIANFVLEKIPVIGVSMEPILQENDKVVINKYAYLLGQPKRFDVIVFQKNNTEHKYYSIKRVIGVPGDKIKIHDGAVYINDEKLQEKIKLDAILSGGLAEEELQLEKNEYFVLGDNRNQSEDSRYASIGIISKSEIIGKALLRVSPTLSIIDMLTDTTDNK